MQIYGENLVRLGIMEPTRSDADLYSDTDDSTQARFSSVLREYEEEISSFYKSNTDDGLQEKLRYLKFDFTDYGKLFVGAIRNKSS